MPATDAHITAQRRKLILEVVAFRYKSLAHGKGTTGCTVAEVNRTLEEWMAQGMITWPQATWPGAINVPYQVGTSQHLRAMIRERTVTRDGGRWVPVVVGLRRRAEEVLQLKSEGKSGVAIAELLGLSKSLVYSLLKDPTGEQEKERKRRYCGSCGARKPPEATVCTNCREKAAERAEELLPPSTFIAFITRAREHGYELLFGVTHDLRRVIRVGIGRGFFEHEVRSDLDWLDAVREVAEEIGVVLDA